MGTSFTELKLYLREAPFVISSHISPLHETLCACRVELFAEASEIFKHTVFRLVVLGVYPSRGRKMEVGWF